MSDGRRWFALRAKLNYERLVFDLLAQKGFESFLPTYRQRRGWSDRLKNLNKPLFDGYVFCRMSIGTKVRVLQTPGVLAIVGIGRTPEPIPDIEISNLQQVVNPSCQLSPWAYLAAGKRVIVDSGPLAGIEGLVVEYKSEKRLVISIQLLQRSVAVELDSRWIYPLDKPTDWPRARMLGTE